MSKVGITEFPENFTRGTPRPKGSEIKRIFNLGAQNGRYHYNSNSSCSENWRFRGFLLSDFTDFHAFSQISNFLAAC